VHNFEADFVRSTSMGMDGPLAPHSAREGLMTLHFPSLHSQTACFSASPCVVKNGRGRRVYKAESFSDQSLRGRSNA
jgi:hypothetical protein